MSDGKPVTEQIGDAYESAKKGASDMIFGKSNEDKVKDGSKEAAEGAKDAVGGAVEDAGKKI